MINIEYNLRQRLLLVMSEIALSHDKQKKILDLFVSPEIMWQGIEAKKTSIIALCGESAYSRLKYSLVKSFADKIENDLCSKDIRAVTIFDAQYPQSLREVFDAPTVLYCKGDVALLKSDSIAIVGTRKVTPYGKKTTTFFASELAKYFCIVSGLAYGVDTTAHESALEVGAKTIAVLGSGLMNIYPSPNQPLARRIVERGGLIVTEHTAYTEPNHYNFPLRNRIIAGLSRALLITEAPQKSGVFSTLEYALEQGKDVYVVPGDIFNVNYKGSNSILRRLQGALVTNPQEILDVYRKPHKENKFAIQLDIEEQVVLDILAREDRLHFDALVEQSAINVGKLNYILSALELKGLIVKQAGNIYQYANTEIE